MCDRDYEHLTKPGGSPLVGCTPNAAVPGNTVTNALNTKDLSLVYAQLFRNYQTDGTTSMANLPLSSSTNTGFLGLVPTAVVGQSMVSCEEYQNCYAYPFTYNGVQVTRAYWVQGATTDTPYDADDIFRCGVAAYFDSKLNKCFLDLKVLPLYTALCQNQEVAATCTCQGFVQQEAAGAKQLTSVHSVGAAHPAAAATLRGSTATPRSEMAGKPPTSARREPTEARTNWHLEALAYSPWCRRVSSTVRTCTRCSSPARRRED